MDFLGIGPLELLLILVILIVVLGPEKIPDIARRLGKAVRAFRAATSSLTQEIEREMRSLDAAAPASRKQEKGTGDEVRSAERQRDSSKG